MSRSPRVARAPMLTLATVLATGAMAPARAQDAAPGTTASSDVARQDQQDQLDRIEAKLDTLLQRLGSGEDVNAAGIPAPSGTSGSASDPSTAASDAAAPPGAGVEPETAPTPTDTSAEAESYAPDAIAVVHAAPTQGQALNEIPADSIGGFVYTGGPIRLSDLADRGVRYAGPAGIELQGWLKATEAGRHQIAADLQVRFGPGAIAPLPCSLNGWLEDQAIGAETRNVEPWGAKGEPIPLSLVLGAELQPGLYKLRLWVACADLLTARDGDSVQAEVLVKGPGEMNLRPVTGEDMLHRQ
ncbi:hypothetical protein [uncultured Jannaschia sp.]|uniref:hypothetical protein n=1 Tax=uncultured Jannaschia sp. TaxID=293347 RepID=UPI002626D839|nr:hypothetical protein [uncultured Jannaschia sp.]